MKRLFRYGVSGVINTVVTYGMYLILVGFIDYRIAIVLVYAFGMALSFALQGRYVFRAQGSVWRFIAVYVALLVVNMSVTTCLVEGLHYSKQVAQLMAIFCVMIQGFLMSKYLVFKQGRWV